MKNKHTFAFFYTTVLVIFTVWSLLDTFVIADKIAVVDETLANTSIYADLENEQSSNNNLDSDLNEYSSNINSGNASGSDSNENSEGDN